MFKLKPRKIINCETRSKKENERERERERGGGEGERENIAKITI